MSTSTPALPVPSPASMAARMGSAQKATRVSQPARLASVAGVRISDHLTSQARLKGISMERVASALTAPYKITDVSAYPGQKRYCGAGVAVVVSVDRVAVTVYLDGVVTALRPDQMNDARAVASRRCGVDAARVGA